MPTPAASQKIGFVSLGCPKALVDSERILTQLKVEGYQIVPSYGEADAVVVNTCGFIDAAVQESLDGCRVLRSSKHRPRGTARFMSARSIGY